MRIASWSRRCVEALTTLTVDETVQPIFGELVPGPTKSNSTKVIAMPRSIASRTGLPEAYRTHDLRHTHASTLIELGAHPKAVSDRLGHADIGVR